MSGRMELELEPELDLDSYEKNVDSILAAKPLLTKAKEEFHGLRVSEYTVLLSWIGAVKSKELSLSKKKKQQDVSSQQWKEPVPSLSLSSKDVKKLLLQKSQEQKQSLPGKPSLFSSATPSTQQQQPVDYTWAIWQDFLMTGMKPDVVLYTALMDRLLKSNHLDQADEIRQHMEQQQRQQQQQYPSSSLILSPLSSLPTSGPLSSSGSEKTKRLKNEVRSRTPVKTTTVRATMPTSLLSTTTTAVAVSPNLQTFSVMMQKYVQNRDLEGRQQHDDDNNDEGLSLSSSATKANTVLLNQILAALISLGESRAACDIFAEMQQSSALNAVPTTIAATSTTETNYAISGPIDLYSKWRDVNVTENWNAKSCSRDRTRDPLIYGGVNMGAARADSNFCLSC
ncbi:hypothetical protein BG004_004897 [Podila humilis]|nr:hypothetical protein BG004_004897 [Podila humilis]